MKRINGNARRWKKSSTPDEMARWSGGSGSIKPDEMDLGSFVDQNAALSCSWRDAQIESENERALHERSYTDRRDTEVLQRSTSDRVTRTRKREIERVTKMPIPQSVPLIMNNSNDRTEDAHEWLTWDRNRIRPIRSDDQRRNQLPQEPTTEWFFSLWHPVDSSREENAGFP